MTVAILQEDPMHIQGKHPCFHKLSRQMQERLIFENIIPEI